jgi:hypothetical protein
MFFKRSEELMPVYLLLPARTRHIDVGVTLAILYEDGMRVVPQGRSGEGRGQLHNLGSFYIPCRQSPSCTCRASLCAPPLSYEINNETP